jgi:hypothetical protein
VLCQKPCYYFNTCETMKQNTHKICNTSNIYYKKCIVKEINKNCVNIALKFATFLLHTPNKLLMIRRLALALKARGVRVT